MRVDDRLLEVNGVSLLGQSNIDAMETLRHAMHAAGPEPGSISIAVARSTAPAADAVAMTTGDAFDKTPCLRQSSSSGAHLQSRDVQSRGLMPPPSTTKVLSVRKPPAAARVGCCLPFRFLYQLALSVFIMAALRNRAGRYIFALWFLLLSSSSFFFSHLFSAVADWMSTILPHIVWR